MTVATQPKKAQRRLLIGILLAVPLGFGLLLLALAQSGARPAAATANQYAAEVAAVMAGAEAARGAALLPAQDCLPCHLDGDTNLAPPVTGLGAIAGQRRPPLSAEQYLYEAILFPAAYLVEGYSDSMAKNYGDKLTAAQIGDIIAYLLTLTGGGDSP